MTDNRCFIDFESTGVDPLLARIVEIAMRRGEERLVTLVDPGIPIPPEVSEVHGITDEMVAGAPPFSAHAEQIERMIYGAVLVGYNIRRFDTLLLDAELRRCGRPGLPRDADGCLDVREIDLYRIWQELEPRNLTTAARRFADIEHAEDAHRAENDIDVLEPILYGMLEDFSPALAERGLGAVGDDDLIGLCRPADEVDRDGKFKRREADGKIVFDFGQHAGKPVAAHMDYIVWMLSKDFSPETKAWCRRFQKMAKGGAS